jgi:hypothetical protein
MFFKRGIASREQNFPNRTRKYEIKNLLPAIFIRYIKSMCCKWEEMEVAADVWGREEKLVNMLIVLFLSDEREI